MEYLQMQQQLGALWRSERSPYACMLCSFLENKMESVFDNLTDYGIWFHVMHTVILRYTPCEEEIKKSILNVAFFW